MGIQNADAIVGCSSAAAIQRDEGGGDRLLKLNACVVAEYPSQLTLSGLVNLAGGLQCAVISLIFEKPAALRLRWDLQLLAIAYSGIFCGGLGVFAMMWCVKETGPVYVTAFSPMSTVMVAIREGAIAASCATHLEQPDRHGLGHRRSLLVSVGQKLKKWRVFCCNSRRGRVGQT
ncbi:hypothetical protein OPV22_024413 [Ensete ventricosum]|uniref:WAT1-related protein n=1 Tax=Ensete ventricosum TaxID=4639 RepID=A0AAV8P7C9_ENSVE|nr:hypothetical protein OPV22_024413 [Ensete ventricosum]